MPPSCEALVLAAGAGTRMGGPKALLEQNGRPLLVLHVERALELGAAHVSAIVRPEVAQLLAPQLARYSGKLSLIAESTESQASSLALLIRERARVREHDTDLTFLITPVDVFPCAESTYRAVWQALDPGILAATPTFQARGGHPVLVRGELLRPYLDGPLDTRPTLRDLLQQAGTRRRKVEIEDATILTDLDTPEDAERYSVTIPW